MSVYVGSNIVDKVNDLSDEELVKRHKELAKKPEAELILELLAISTVLPLRRDKAFYKLCRSRRKAIRTLYRKQHWLLRHFT